MIWTILIIAGIVLFIIVKLITREKEEEVREIKQEHQIQEGKIKYTDLDKPANPFFSNKIRLVGKPDYIVKQGNFHIPVEVKKGNPKTPYQSHIMQLIAYCYLVEEKYNEKIPFGVLIYENTQIKVPYTEKEKAELLATMNIMRTQKVFKRNHNSINKCHSCGFNSACDEKIT